METIDPGQELPEPDEAELPPKPPIPEVEEDDSIPGEEPVPEEEFQSPEDADADPRTDNNEGDFMDETATPTPDTTPPGEDPAESPVEGDVYDGGEIPPAPAEDVPGEAVPAEENPAS